jgi:transcriptional regulator with XRE-family HTH domain
MKYRDFGDRFSMACREADPVLPTTNEGLSKIFGVSPPMISYWRKGDKLPAMETAQRIAKRCGICVEWLLTGRGPKYPETPTKKISQAASLAIRAIPELTDTQLEIVSSMVRELLAGSRKADN